MSESKLSDAIKTWLWCDLIIAVAMYAYLGTEGMAELACTVIDDPVCEQFD